jgi:DNA-binding NarL/FixJ family response regulator
MPKIKCLLVDDHILFRQGIRRLLESESDIEVVGEASDAVVALAKARELQPNVILFDIGMPGLSPFEAARHIRKDLPNTKIVFLTMYNDEEYLIQGLEAGAVGYVLKDAAASQLLTAIREVYSGGRYFSSQMFDTIIEEFRARIAGLKRLPGRMALTSREREILKLLAEGDTTKQISVLLAVSVKTVEAHKYNLMRKLDLHNKAQLVAYAFQNKIVRLPMDPSLEPV